MGSRQYMKICGSFFVLFIFALSFASGNQAIAAEYPDRAITLVIPYPPGGVTDLGARALAEAMEKELKKPVVAVNKPGGSTTMGGNAVATAKPDGYTIGFFPSSASIPEVYTYFYEAPFSSKDLKPVSQVAIPVLTIAVKGDSPMNSVKDLVEYAQKNPGAKIGIHGKSTQGYLAMKSIAKAEGISLIDVPFDGDTKIVPAILGGHVPAGTPAYPAVISLIDAKQIKVLALLLDKRADFAPNIPTITELGYHFALGAYLGVFAPKGTPDAIIKKLNDAIGKIAQDPQFRAKIHGMGTQVRFQDTKAFEKSINQYKDALQVFFKEEGLVK
ncbi:MAG TPA: tripartite tricarboxylate transporter substrate binding protein [Syntrophorhabdales bacterium]|nr:tripartite tricarboxylate transporter substrate binding protein [Syntrophorhabdales bacterium]